MNRSRTRATWTFSEEIRNVADSGSCPSNGDAWYFDDPNVPLHVVLCPLTCSSGAGDPTSSVSLLNGCPTVH